MSDNSAIEWTDATWQILSGCSPVSEGCRLCYSAHLAGTRMRRHPRTVGLTRETEDGRHVFNGTLRLHEDQLDLPLRWTRPRRIFVGDRGDLFHESVPDGFIMRVWSVMARSLQHTFQILTKRPERMLDFVTRWADLTGESFEPKLVSGPEETRAAHPSGRGQLFAAMLESMGKPPKGCAYPFFDWMQGMRWWPAALPNVWLGTSVEGPRQAEERVSHLLETPAAVRWISYEPALGLVDFDHIHVEGGTYHALSRALGVDGRGTVAAPGLDWIVIGGESAQGRFRARRMDLSVPRSLIAATRGTPCKVYVKQLGTVLAEVHGLRHPRGADPAEWPEDLRVREFPEGM